jgi:tricorn protease
MSKRVTGRRAHGALMGALMGSVAAAVITGAMAGSALAAETSKPSLAEPSLSPDGSKIAFVSGGDIWEAPAQGGEAHLLVTDPATESRPLYSPDGSQLAFQSTRNGSANIYVLTLATGEIRRLTYADASEQLDGWSRDGQWLYFTSGATDVGRQGDILRVSVAGGTPLEVSRERYLNEFESAPSPDGSTLALVAKGISSQQWWRNGHAHIDETEIWLKPVAEGAPYRRLLPADAKHAWPMWGPDGKALWFMSDQTGAENLWRLDLGSGSAQPVTQFKGGRVLWPSIASDGSAIVFERGFGIWKLDARTGQAAQVQIDLRGAPASAGSKHLNETSFRAMALSPDGKKVAVIAHGEVFAASAKDGGAAQRITDTLAAESEPVWSPDSRRLIYVSERGLDSKLMEYDFATQKERALTTASGIDEAPSFSPDGKRIAYIHADKELHVITLGEGGATAQDTVIYTGAVAFGGGATTPAWSPDSKWLAFPITDRKSFTNVNVIEATGGTPHPVSFLANGQTASQIAWSPDGKYLLFDTAQRAEDTHMVRVDLVPHVPKYREDAFRDLFKPGDATPDQKSGPSKPGKPGKPSGPDKALADKTLGGQDDAKPDAPKTDGGGDAAKKPGAKKVEPVKIVFEGIRERASFLPLGLDASNPVISPDGKTLVFAANVAGKTNLYSYNLDELAKEPPTPQQLTSTARDKAAWAFTPDSKEIFYLDGGTVNSTPIENAKPKPLAINGEMDVDFDREKQVVFDEAWGTLDHRFFDPNFNGADWKALRAQWQPYISGVRTPDELRRDINLLIGELNASHSGINRPGSEAPKPRVGDLGLRFEREPYEAGKGLVIREVITLGPSALEGSIKPGERLVAVDGRPVGPHANLDALLLDKAGKRTVLRIAGAGGERDAVLRPISGGAASGLLYRQWVNERRAYVEKISGGRLGYVHIADMGDGSLNQLYIDLDAQNEGRQGVVIDVRNNNGGYINGRVLDVLSRREFLTMTPRGLFALPSRQALGQRALGLPTVLVTNESSLSDAEDFTEGYRALGLGKVVGVPTAGWIIYTSGQPLIDGSVVRVPFIRVQGAKGDDMELHPRPVDVMVERPLGETAAGRDAQLEGAVKTLLDQIDGK